ncbi:MAG: hypothetical protein OSB27_06720, partial [Planktomarina sp.]|nr:hypothetical protein [Planktomarina sp.]
SLGRGWRARSVGYHPAQTKNLTRHHLFWGQYVFQVTATVGAAYQTCWMTTAQIEQMRTKKGFV